MELIKTEYSQDKGKGKLDKILLNCTDANYYTLINFLYESDNKQAIILNALYDNKINVVLKFGTSLSIKKEYDISLALINLPNFIKYFCVFECNDDIKNIINNKETISQYKMCYYGANPVGILVMKHYILGFVENYTWNQNNLEILKNVMMQVIFAIIYAYETIGFIHGDLHLGNVLLKPKRNNIINYGTKELNIVELEAVIMDFEKSKINQRDKQIDMIRNIYKFITSIENTCANNNLIVNIDKHKIISLKSSFAEGINYFNEIENVIRQMYIYV